MTYARLSAEMSSTELELWMAYSMVKSEQCPNCGLEARDMEYYELKPVHCPHCKHDYKRIARYKNPYETVGA